MAEHSIPVDLLNPGQVFACLGFLEAADILLGDAEGGFDWRDEADTRFRLRAAGEENPVEVVLRFLAEADVKAVAPPGWKPNKKAKNDKERKKLEEDLAAMERSEFFPSKAPETASALPIQLVAHGRTPVTLTHWADETEKRDDFKLYSGNRSALSIATAMLKGTCSKPGKKQNRGELITHGVATLWETDSQVLCNDPFIITPIGGSFNFDPRGGWNPIDSGYSPDKQNHKVVSSPVVEMLAAWGMENARPQRSGRDVRYAVWGIDLPPLLARVALAQNASSFPLKYFHFSLATSGKNKIVTFAEEEPTL